MPGFRIVFMSSQSDRIQQVALCSNAKALLATSLCPCLVGYESEAVSAAEAFVNLGLLCCPTRQQLCEQQMPKQSYTRGLLVDASLL